jgi:hypothetical protein
MWSASILARGFLNVGGAPPCGEPIPSRSNPSEAVEIADQHGGAVRKIAPPESGAYALAGSGGRGDGERDPAVQYKNAQDPSWFHRRSKGSTSLIAGNRRRPSGIGAVGRSLSAALGPTSIVARYPRGNAVHLLPRALSEHEAIRIH